LRELGCEVGASASPGPFTIDGAALRVVVGQARTPGDEPRPYIALSIAQDHVVVALELPPGAVCVVRARLADPMRALELATALQALPEQFTIGVTDVGGDPSRSPVSLGSTDHIRALLDRAEREQRPLWLGWSVTRDVALAHAALLDEQLEDAAVALGSVLVILASAVDGAIPHGSSRAMPRRERRDRGRGEEERPATKRRARQRTEARDRAGEADAEADGGDTDAPPAAGPRAPVSAKGSAPGAKRPAHGGGGGHDGRASPRASPDGRSKARGSAQALDKGVRVRVLEGPFAGKVGVVQELDGRGGARVMLGLLAVRLEVRDLARSAEGRRRPVLSTSHRKPLPVRS
jgi:hypothetical protein